MVLGDRRHNHREANLNTHTHARAPLLETWTQKLSASFWYCADNRPKLLGSEKIFEFFFILKRRLHVQFVKRFGILFEPNIVPP